MRCKKKMYFYYWLQKCHHSVHYCKLSIYFTTKLLCDSPQHNKFITVTTAFFWAGRWISVWDFFFWAAEPGQWLGVPAASAAPTGTPRSAGGVPKTVPLAARRSPPAPVGREVPPRRRRPSSGAPRAGPPPRRPSPPSTTPAAVGRRRRRRPRQSLFQIIVGGRSVTYWAGTHIEDSKNQGMFASPALERRRARAV